MAEIEIQSLYDDGDELCEYLVRGHVDKDAVVAALQAECPNRRGAWLPEDVTHEWRRAVPDSQGTRMVVYHPAEPGSRGAFKATVVEVWGPYNRSRAPSPSPTGPGGEP